MIEEIVMICSLIFTLGIVAAAIFINLFTAAKKASKKWEELMKDMEDDLK